jgi:hypothetical protein
MPTRFILILLWGIFCLTSPSQAKVSPYNWTLDTKIEILSWDITEADPIVWSSIWFDATSVWSPSFELVPDWMLDSPNKSFDYSLLIHNSSCGESQTLYLTPLSAFPRQLNSNMQAKETGLTSTCRANIPWIWLGKEGHQVLGVFEILDGLETHQSSVLSYIQTLDSTAASRTDITLRSSNYKPSPYLYRPASLESYDHHPINRVFQIHSGLETIFRTQSLKISATRLSFPSYHAFKTWKLAQKSWLYFPVPTPKDTLIFRSKIQISDFQGCSSAEIDGYSKHTNAIQYGFVSQAICDPNAIQHWNSNQKSLILQYSPDTSPITLWAYPKSAFPQTHHKTLEQLFRVF